MNYFSKNMIALKTMYNELADMVSEEIDNNEMLVSVQKVEEKNVLVLEKDNVLFQLDSLYDEDAITDCWYRAISMDLKFKKNLIMFGFGNGMFVKKYLECSDEHDVIKVYEPSIAIFREVLHYFDVYDILMNPRFKLVVPNGMSEISISNVLMSNITYADVNNVKIISYANYNMLFEEEFAKFKSIVNRGIIRIVVDSSFMSRWGCVLNDNTEKNMSAFVDSKSIADIKGKAKEIPAIIVSAGPSLDKNICDLKEAKGKAIIIGVDSAFKSLVRNGIRPDIIVSGDPTKDDKYFNGDNCNDIPLFASLHTGWKLIDAHKGVKFFENRMDTYVHHFACINGVDLMSLSTGGSVANTAFSVARILDCSPIILIGQDLAYPNDKTHAEDSVVACRTVEELDGNIYVDDIYGNRVRTSMDMNRYREWFERIIEDNSDLNVYDATEGGAYIKGTKIIRLKEAIEKFCYKEFDISRIFEDAGYLFEGKLKNEFVEYIMDLPKQMENVKTRIDDLSKIYDRMFELVHSDNYKTKEMINLSRESNDILYEIEYSPSVIYAFNHIHDKINRIFGDINTLESDEKEELIDVVAKSKKYIELISTAIEDVLPEINDMLDAVSQNKR